METVGVIGGGQMGSQIAALAAMAGYDTHVYDSDADNLKTKIKFTKDNLVNLIDKGRYEKSKLDNFKEHLQTSDSVDETISNKSFVIEAVVERLDVKLEIFENISKKLDENVVLATNSSFIPASELAKSCEHPSRFINMHFFYPPIRMDLVEISYPEGTNNDTIERTQRLGKDMGRTVITCKKETPGFIVNRMLAALTDEAYQLYDEGIADFKDIDTAIKKGLNHPLGPFELSDYSGLDIHYYAKLKIFNETQDPKDYPKDFLEEKVKKGELGVKSGKGFYDYS
ncbi:MAG: 3-hydroxyacyl-CoA dehydrogenase family protein [Actinomycetota bacterium]|nr:3-hydroxyacyl-CoA dehydrogenase family protein [Actinomycetota bacterium]|tara:strand:+ start:1181 stop:2032 length:852 start_codon:yes stop_codon:yes gene_type:complete